MEVPFMSEELFVKLRYCFQAGYTLPQFCIDKGIKKPLLVLEKNFEWFLREIYAQFHYDGRVTPVFCFSDIDEKYSMLPLYLPLGLFRPKIAVKSISALKPGDFEEVILLTKENPKIDCKKIIRFADLERFFMQRTHVDIPLLSFLQRFPKVKLFLTNFPSLGQYKGGKEFSSKLMSADELVKLILNSGGKHVETPLDRFGYTNEQVVELVLASKVQRNPDGSSSMLSGDYPLRRIENGKRATAYQPENFQNKIYIFGSCHQYGINAPFDKTIESYLQKMLNENNLPYRVENEGQHFAGRYQDIFYNLNKLNPNPGDIIFFWVANLHSNEDVIPFCDISDAFDPPHDFREMFCRKAHVNELGYKLVAEKYFDFLTTNNFFRDVDFNYPAPPPVCHRYGIPPQFESGEEKIFVNEDLEAYKKILRAKKIPIGALVMNCNPFTLGHQYLVEYAAARVTKLYLFVVEEDKSEFPFADRIELVRQGVKNFSNVEVLPSGKFIISKQTFSGYFNKAELQDVAVDSSEDVEIFGREIAPTLGITIRFAGEEPKDNVTRQYNETMKKILPRYGVEFQEIPRKTFDGEFISASSVREALKRGDFDSTK